MPPPISATLLKAVIFPPSRHHSPSSPFIYAKKRKPVAEPLRIGADVRRKVLDRIGTTGNALLLLKAPSVRGGRRGWTRSVSAGTLLVAAREGEASSTQARRWACGGVDRGRNGVPVQATGSVQSLEGGLDINGGYEKKKDEKEEEEEERSPPGILTLPTVLTLGRVAAVPLLVITFYMNGSWATTATTGIFVAAAITDWLDGYIARKMALRTTFGAFLDPVADKLMVAAALVLLCTRPPAATMFGEVPWLLTVPSIAIIGREITMSAVREWAASQDTRVLEAVAVNNLGKWKTATQMTALTILLATRDTSLMGPSVLVPSGVALLYISSGLAVCSLAVYMKNIWRILLK